LRAAVLSVVAGYVDSYALVHYGVYVSFMSGNTTITGLRAGQGQLGPAARNLLPVLPFVCGAFLGTVILGQIRHPLRRSCGLVAAILSAGLAATCLSSRPGHWLTVVLSSLAMGVLNSTFTHVGGERVAIGYMTGDLIGLGAHLAMAARRAPASDAQGSWDTHWWRALLLTRAWGSFLLGALVGGASVGHLGMWALLPPIVALAVLSLAMPRD
jgi:uncharacterized membrane protein YoaK (UPF0700 family)